MMEEISVRGIKGGVLISLPDKPWYQQRDLLISRIQTQERFFKGGRIALDVGSADWSQDQLFKLLRDLSDEGVCLWAVLTTSEITLESARNYELQTSISSQPLAVKPENVPSTTIEQECRMAYQTAGKGRKSGFQGKWRIDWRCTRRSGGCCLWQSDRVGHHQGKRESWLRRGYALATMCFTLCWYRNNSVWAVCGNAQKTAESWSD